MSKKLTATALLLIASLSAACDPNVGVHTSQTATPAASPAATVSQSSDAPRPDAAQQSSQEQRKPDPPQRAERMRCTPETLRRGDTLTVELTPPHGGYLAVINPRKKFFFLTAEETGARGPDRRAGAEPLWQVEEFAKMSRLALDTSRAKAVDWSRDWPGGEGKAELIFNESGAYEILVGAESIDQEGAPYDFKCRVRYEAEPR